MEKIFLWIFIIVAAGLLGALAWFSAQSLLQAAVILRTRNAPLQAGSLASVHGPVQIVRPIDAHGYRQCLWFKVEHQERRGWGRNRRWVTVGRDEGHAHFYVSRAGVRILVTDPASEMQGTKSRTESDSWIFSNSRTVHRWLDAPPALTVLGRLESLGGDLVMRKDPRVGLLFSPYVPGWAATWEIVKGVLGLAAVGVGLYYGVVVLGGLDPALGL